MLELLRQRLRSKTYIAATIMAILTIIEANYGVLATLLPPKWAAYTPLVFPIVMMLCREVTRTALSDK